MDQVVSHSSLPLTPDDTQAGYFSSLRASALSMGISEQQVSAVRAIAIWAELLNHPNGEGQDLKEMAKVLGLLPEDKGLYKRALNYPSSPRAERNGQLDYAKDRLVSDFLADANKVEAFLSAQGADLKRFCSDLNISSLRLLQSMVRQQISLDCHDLTELTKSFPFPITRSNYFGRFISGGCEDPGIAVRHLYCATPFFVRIKALLESLNNEKRKIITLAPIELVTEEDKNGNEVETKREMPISREMAEIIKACVVNARDFFGRTGSATACIALPKFLSNDYVVDTVSARDRVQLAAEFAEWLLIGETNSSLFKKGALAKKEEEAVRRIKEELAQLRAVHERIKNAKPKRDKRNGKPADESHSERLKKWRGHMAQAMLAVENAGSRLSEAEARLAKKTPILFRKQLSPKKERRFLNLKRRLRTEKEKHQTITKDRPADSEPKAVHHIWQRKLKAADDKVNDLKWEVDQLAEERRQLDPLIKRLRQGVESKSALTELRSRVGEALSEGKQIVFTAFKAENGAPLLQILDHIWTNPKYSSLPSVRILKQAAMLLCVDSGKILKDSSPNGAHGVYVHQHRTFEIDRSEVNPSVRYTVARILPNRAHPRYNELYETLVKTHQPPGIRSKAQLAYLAAEWAGKKNATIIDCIDYVFEHSPKVLESDLYEISEVLLRLGQNEFPERSRRVLIDRHNIPESLFESYKSYRQNYRPDKLGQLPELFRDMATLVDYRNLELDTCGMKKEVSELEAFLCGEERIVGIVDGTSYHPELLKDIHGVSVQENIEKTSEIYGDYVRPVQRLLNNFAHRLMESKVPPALQNASLIGVHNPDGFDRAVEKLIRKFYGIEVEWTPDLSRVNNVLSELAIYDKNAILVIDAANVKDLKQYGTFMKALQKHDLKVIVANLREPLPGIKNIQIQPFLDQEVGARLQEDAELISRKLGLKKRISTEVIEFTTRQVSMMRRSSDDPLNLSLSVLHAAAENAKLRGKHELGIQYIVESLPTIFHIPSIDQIREKIATINKFNQHAPTQILGQRQAIEKIGNAISSHILGLRDATRPLSLLITGPTGVGKTEYMFKLSLALGIPFFGIEGAEYSEPHSVSRLTGSPPGYVGADEGALFQFLDKNVISVVFIDEIEKMHPDVYMALMDFFDKAVLTSGGGRMIRRPGTIIAGASNAGADRLHREMSKKEIRETLADSFLDRHGHPRPELVRRFDPVMMLAIEQSEFKLAAHSFVHSLKDRYGIISAGVRINEIEDSAVSILYESSKDVCAYNEKALKTGSKRPITGFGHNGSAIYDQDYFFDLRHLSRALDEVAGESIREVVLERFTSMRSSEQEVLRIDLYGEDGRILVRPSRSSEETGI